MWQRLVERDGAAIREQFIACSQRQTRRGTGSPAASFGTDEIVQFAISQNLGGSGLFQHDRVIFREPGIPRRIEAIKRVQLDPGQSPCDV